MQSSAGTFKKLFLPLGEMDRVARQGGYIVLGIPNLAALHNRLLLISGNQPLCNEIEGPHVRCFTHKGFLKFLAENRNFRLIAVDGATLYPFPYPFVEFGAKYFPGFASYTFYLLKKVSHSTPSHWNNRKEFDTCL